MTDPYDGRKHYNSLELYKILFKQAARFNRLMALEHVEDVMVEKHVVTIDEDYKLDEFLDHAHQRGSRSIIEDEDFGGRVTGNGLETVANILMEIERVNRRRRNYLLLRDFSKRRPW